MNEKVIWDFLYSKINNPYGVAALMGNLYVESTLNPKNLQGSYERKLNMTDEQYTKAVDNWQYTNFVYDSAGYGLAQWTYHTRKEALLDFANRSNRSIGDLYMQLEFLWKELQSYKTCLRSVCEAKSVKEASDVIVTQYEKPTDQSEKGKQNRADYGQKFFDMFATMKGESVMISLTDFLSAIQKNAGRIKSYKLGNDGSDGTSDCIGLIIGALKLAGMSWPGIHGSNWTVRNGMSSFEYIENASKFYVGEVVYKAREPSDPKYDLPSSYNNSPDKRDYYHVGVVTSVKPLCITHCSGGGIHRDTTQGSWKYGGQIKYVNYNSSGEKKMDEEPLYRAIVIADTGSSVRMRSQPSVTSKILYDIPIGTDVEVMDVLDGWSQIRYNGQDGYMMSKFLDSESSAKKPETSGVTFAQLRQIQINLLDALEVINTALGAKQ